jgi:molybdopterin molybdotransferase
MLTPAEAARRIVQAVTPLPPEPLPLRDALDHVLAEDVVSPLDLPPWDNSGMDGWAVRAQDLTGPGVALAVIETVAAGQMPRRPLGPGQATRVFTGAPIPAGADTVIRQEDATAGSDRVVINDLRDAGRNVRRRGDDIRAGTTVVPRGSALGPAQLGVLAAVAHGTPLVHRTPRVALFASGDEIAELDDAQAIIEGRKIASANSYTLHALLRRAGAVPLDLGIARDDRASVRAHFERARGADLIVTSAGVSVGEHDLLRDVLVGAGGTITFWRVRMRPGAPVAFGSLDGVPWIGLPGNPVSTMVTFELFVRAAIRRLLGHTQPYRRTVPVRLAEDVKLGPPLRHYLRATLEPAESDGVPRARLTGPQGSGILTSMARAHALVIVPEDRAAAAAGEVLQAIVLDDPVHAPDPAY